MRKLLFLALAVICSVLFASKSKENIPVHAIPNNSMVTTLYTNSNIILGNPKGSVTVVEVYDYNCMYCKLLALDLGKLLKQNNNIRLVKIPVAILDDSSLPAAKYALVANMQSKFDKLDQLLLKAKSYDETSLNAMANEAGLDLTKLHTDLNSPKLFDVQLANDRVGLMGFLFGSETGLPMTIVANTKAPHINQIVIGNHIDQIKTIIEKLSANQGLNQFYPAKKHGACS